MKANTALRIYPCAALLILGFAVWNVIDGLYAHAAVEVIFAVVTFSYWRRVKKGLAENKRLRRLVADNASYLN